ncbi:MAG: glycosyltransferase [Pseudomonadota bacterium]
MLKRHSFPFHTNLFRGLRALWVRLPKSVRHEFWTLAGTRWQSTYARARIAKPAARREANPTDPIVVAGLFSTANGIGEGARNTYRALKAAGLDPIAVDLSEPFAPIDVKTDILCQQMPDSEQGTLILQLNGPETMSALQHLGMEFERNWFTIGYWAWELPVFPAQWDDAFPYLSEIWTISEFSASAIKQHPKAPPVEVFGHAISTPTKLHQSRQKFGWKDQEFVFLTMADSMSSLERKNPFSAIRAFKSAFAHDPRYRLVVKTRNLNRHALARDDLNAAIGDNPNIQLFDESLSEEDIWLLINSADAFVSLHRSEGFGLVLAEAMALGKPVICTDWSGNMDFTTNDTAALVASTLVNCKDKYGVYRDLNTKWAHADEQMAAELMKKVSGNKEFRTNLAARAKERIVEVADVRKIGAQMSDRLSLLASARFAPDI